MQPERGLEPAPVTKPKKSKAGIKPPRPMPMKRSKPKRTQAERREESTGRLLDAALSLLGERRSLDFSMAEVADRAGYSRGMPTHSFGTRDEMIRQLVPHLHVMSGDLFGNPKDRGSGIEAVLKSAALLLDPSPGQADLTIAVHVLLAEAASPDSPFREQVQHLNEAATSFIHRNLEEAVARGEIKPIHCSKSTSMLVMAMIRGSLLQWLVDPAVPVEDLRQELLAILRSLFELEK